MFNLLRKKDKPTIDDYGMYISAIAEYFCTMDKVEGQDEASQKCLVDHFNVDMIMRIAGPLMIMGDERLFLALSRLHMAFMDRVDEKLGYSPHKTPFDLVKELDEQISSDSAKPESTEGVEIRGVLKG